MMKLKSFVFGILSCVSVLSFANHASQSDYSSNPFAGLFAGVGVGYDRTQVKYTANPTPMTQTVSDNAIIGQALVGYNYGINAHWLLGAELSLTYDSANSKINVTIPFVGNMDTSTKMPYVYGIDALVGYAFNPSAMAFAGAGISSSNLKASCNGVYVYSSSDTFTGWKAFAGAQQKLVGHLSLRETLAYTSYRSKTIILSTLKTEPSNYSGLLSLIYTFNS